MRYTTDVIRRVFDDDHGYWLEVGPDADGLGCVELRCVGDDNIGYWGALRLSMPAGFAAKIGEALIAASEEATEA
jgi:hypothetical protein